MIPCDFGGRRVPFPLYAGEPVLDAHPMEQQAAWLERERGGVVPADVMDSFAKLREIAAENNVNFAELTVYAMNEAANQEAQAADGQAPDPADQDVTAAAPEPSPPSGRRWWRPRRRSG